MSEIMAVRFSLPQPCGGESRIGRDLPDEAVRPPYSPGEERLNVVAFHGLLSRYVMPEADSHSLPVELLKRFSLTRVEHRMVDRRTVFYHRSNVATIEPE